MTTKIIRPSQPTAITPKVFARPSAQAPTNSVEVGHRIEQELESAHTLQKQLANVSRRLAAARAKEWQGRKPPKVKLQHTCGRVQRIARRGLDGKQEWRDYRRVFGRCSLTDGWYMAAEIQNVLLVATWHQESDKNGYPDGEFTVEYVVVDRVRSYALTTSLRYAKEVFIFACLRELLRGLSKQEVTAGSERLRRFKSFIRKERGLANDQDGRDEALDCTDWISGSFEISPWDKGD